MELRDSSDYLTNEVRSFAVTGELSHFRKYWDEARNEKHREKAIAEMEKADLPNDKQMQEWVAYVRSYPLEKDYQCAAEKKKQQSEMMLYGVTYETYKKLIDSNVEKFQSELNGRLDQTVKKAAGASKKAFFIQLIFGFCEIAVLMFILILFQKSYINPVMKYKRTIERQQGRRQIYIQPEGVWELRQFAQEFNALSQDMLEEINEILDYSKLQSGKMIFENKNFSLYQLTENLQAFFENEAEKRNLFFWVEVGKDVPEYVHGDPLRLKQVLTNLIYNGIKFTPV